MESLARRIFDMHVDVPGVSYAATNPALNAAWPTAQNQVADKQFYAAAWLSGIFTDDVALRNTLNYYFSFTEETHDWRPCTVDMDNFFVAGNLVMSLFETFDTRYQLHVERCVATWTGQTIFRGEQPSPLVVRAGADGQLLLRRTVAGGDAADVGGPRPLPLAMRAMAIVAAVTADRIEPLRVPLRRNLISACFSIQQLRHLVGYNSAQQSFVAGIAASGSSWPQQPRVRSATCDAAGPCGQAAVEAAGANPTLALGAFVSGPLLDGSFDDQRLIVEHSGTSILNSAPLLLLTAAHERLALRPQDCLAMGNGAGASV